MTIGRDPAIGIALLLRTYLRRFPDGDLAPLRAGIDRIARRHPREAAALLGGRGG